MSDVIEAVPFLKKNDQNKWYIHPDGISFLRKIVAGKPKHCIQSTSIVGKYRSGKSLIMRKLSDYTVNFELGHTTMGKTRGTDIYARFRGSYNGNEVLEIWFDTEGLYDTENNRDHDMQLFTVICLLSSNLLVNVQTVLDQSTLDQLQLASQMKQLLSDDCDQESEARADNSVLPNLWVIVRDFFLSMEFKGVQETGDEYLERVLTEEGKLSTKVKEKDAIRTGIKQSFNSRHLRTLPVPVNADDLTKLDAIPESMWNAEFREGLDRLCAEIRNKSRPFAIRNDGTSVVATVETFIRAAEHIVDNLNKNKLPGMGTLWENVSERQNTMALQKAQEAFRANLGTSSSAKDVWESEELDTLEAAAFEEGKAVLFQHAIGETSKCLNEFVDATVRKDDSIFKMFIKSNYDKSLKRCQEIKNLAKSNIEKKVVEGFYANADNPYDEFNVDCDEAKKFYDDQPNKGPASDIVYAEAVAELGKSGAIVQSCDKTLTQQRIDLIELERKSTEDRAQWDAKTNALKAQHELEKAENERLMKSLEESAKSQAEAMEQRIKEMKEESESALKESIKAMERNQEAQAAQFSAIVKTLQDQAEAQSVNMLQMQKDHSANMTLISDSVKAMGDSIQALANKPPPTVHIEGCISGKSLVMEKKRGLVEAREIGMGDEVGTLANGKLTYSRVFLVGAMTDEMEVIAITVKSASQMVVVRGTSTHLIYAGPNSELKRIRFDQVKEGYSVNMVTPQGVVEMGFVEKVSQAPSERVCYIYTLNNNILVDRVFISCYETSHWLGILESIDTRALFLASPRIAAYISPKLAWLWEAHAEKWWKGLYKLVAGP